MTQQPEPESPRPHRDKLAEVLGKAGAVYPSTPWPGQAMAIVEAIDALPVTATLGMRRVLQDISDDGNKVEIVVSTGYGTVQGVIQSVSDVVRIYNESNDRTYYVSLAHIVNLWEID